MLSAYEKFYQAFLAYDRWKLYLGGVGITLQITVCSILIGTIIGIVFAFMKISQWKVLGIHPLRVIASVYIDVIRGTPVMVQLFIMYYVILTSPDTSKMVVSIIAFGINSGAYIAEIIRGGIAAVDQGQMEAGRSLGLSGAQTMLFIILPQALKNALPTYASEFIVLIKETAIVGTVGLEDLTKIGSTVMSRTYEAIYPWLIVAGMYLILTLGLSRLFSYMERRLARSDRR